MSNERARGRLSHSSSVVMLACWLLAGWAAPVPVLAADTAASVPAAPQAAVVPTPTAMAAANQLMQLQQDTVVLKAQLKKLDAQQQVAEREASLNQMGRTVTNTEVAVVATQSLGGETSATVRTVDGGELDVRAGDTLPNGMHVVSIRSGAMVIQNLDGQRNTLIVSSPRGSDARLAAMAAPRGAIPPIPTLPSPTR